MELNDRVRMLRSTPRMLSGLAVAGLMALAGCSDDSPAAPDWLPRYGGPVSGDDASLGGTVVREGRCLYIAFEDGETQVRILPLFPEDSTFDEDKQELIVLGKHFPVGSEFRSGGGEVNVDLIPERDLLVYPDPSCQADNGWYVGDV